MKTNPFLNLANPAIIYSIESMTILRTGEEDALKKYHTIMQETLNNPHESSKAVQAQVALGVPEVEAMKTLASMRKEFHVLPLPKSEKLYNQIQTQHGLRQYLESIGRLVLLDEGDDLSSEGAIMQVLQQKLADVKH